MQDVGGARGFNHFVAAGLGVAVGDVVINAVVEQHGILRHHADGSAQGILRDVADVLAVDTDTAGAGIVKTEQQPGQRRFSGATRAHHRHRFSGGNTEADVMQNRTVCIVGKVHVVEFHCARHHIELTCIGCILDFTRPFK